MVEEKLPEFKGLRAVLWPIHNFELKKFLPMGLIMFCMLFNYSTLRTLKDSFVVTTCGAEVISALKMWFVLPSALLFVMLYAKLANALSKTSLFYTVLSIFLGFLACFVLFLYPNRDVLHPDLSGAIESLPSLKWIFLAVQNWTLSLFYIMAELWGSVVLTLMFWQFANDVTSVKEAKRFYSMFGIIGNLGLIVSGHLTQIFTKIGETTVEGVDVWGTTINWLVGAMLVFGVCALFLYSWIQRNVLTDPRLYNPGDAGKPKKKKEKLSISESFKYILSSKYIGFIALLPLCYGISINLVEGAWKSQVRMAFPTANGYASFMGSFQIWMGSASVFCMFIGANILRKFKWHTAAVITPWMILGTGALFFAFMIFNESLDPMMAAMGTTALMMAVIIGQIQNVLSKATKYSLYDSTTQMTYIPLDEELKVKGKAAVDVVGGRMGKSGGALIQWALLACVPGSTLVSIAPTTFAVFLVIMVLWFWTASGLSKEFEALTKGAESEKTAKA
ncbi:MAG: NTP/NDP exchange transporter [Holosporales bacterium]|jgi:AAA family ATP:ADP antiporter|nr:NTP/NDP exchange transporter [Holosporales bacterium]